MGLPNVGKSTLFNSLTKSASAQVANFPFSTIEPNNGEAAVNDGRLGKVAAISGSRQAVPAKTTFVDIAGLVKGAAGGEGLGNKFLAQIREVDAIAHVLRCFDDENVPHVSGRADPVSDAETVETELMLADLETAERMAAKNLRRVKAGDKDAARTDMLLRCALDKLEQGEPAGTAEIQEQDRDIWRRIGLLTAKPVLFVCNVDEESAATGNSMSEAVAEFAKRRNSGHIVICAEIEQELCQLDPDEASEYLAMIGCARSGLDRLVEAGYRLLDLLTFFTANLKQARAWTVPAGSSARIAARVIHEDFYRGFIRAETVSYADYVECGGETGARNAGKLRSEGSGYVVRDGDVIRFLFNV